MNSLPLAFSIVLVGGVAAAQDATDPAGPRSKPGIQPVGSSLAASVGADVIYTNVPGDPKADVPGFPGIHFGPGTGSTHFDRCYGSANGNWVLTADTDAATTNDEVLLSNFLVRAFEGDAIAALGANAGLIDTRCDINDIGQFVWATNTDGATTADEVALAFDSIAGFSVVAQEGATIAALPAATYGATVESPVITRDGRFGISTDTALGVPTTEDDLLIFDDVLLLQEGVSVPPGQSGAELIENFDLGAFFVSADGNHWLVSGDLAGSTSTDGVVILDGTVVLQEGVSVVSGSDPNPIDVSGIVEIFMDHAGNWYARGNNDISEHDWVVRNGAVIAERGGSAAGGAELWDDTDFGDLFFLHVGNGLGDWVVGGVTDAASTANGVLVLNGTSVVCREDDPIDLDGNGSFDDDAFFSTFGNDDALLTDGGEFYFVATMRNGAGTTIGQGYFRVDLDLDTQSYCTSEATSVGEPAVIRVRGSTSVAADDLVLTASPVPDATIGLFFYGGAPTSVPFGNGLRCVDAGAAGLFRLAGHSTGIGFLEEELDIANPSAPAGQITAGSTWYFQAWFRDIAGGGAMFDLSDGMQVTFAP
jgi:hypothetical protein